MSKCFQARVYVCVGGWVLCGCVLWVCGCVFARAINFNLIVQDSDHVVCVVCFCVTVCANVVCVCVCVCVRARVGVCI